MQPVTDAMQLFRAQRAVRDFSDRPVEEATLREILQAAIHAPSGSNTQPWRFIVVRVRAVREAMDAVDSAAQGTRSGAATTPTAEARAPGGMAKAPVLIVPCVRVPERTGQAGFQTGASIYPACQNLMLAAHALGLGSVPTTLHPTVMDRFRGMFGVPKDATFHFCIPLGYPRVELKPSVRRPTAETCFLDRWDGKVPWA